MLYLLYSTINMTDFNNGELAKSPTTPEELFADILAKAGQEYEHFAQDFGINPQAKFGRMGFYLATRRSANDPLIINETIVRDLANNIRNRMLQFVVITREEDTYKIGIAPQAFHGSHTLEETDEYGYPKNYEQIVMFEQTPEGSIVAGLPLDIVALIDEAFNTYQPLLDGMVSRLSNIAIASCAKTS